MRTKAQILERMALYRMHGGGIASWLTEGTCEAVFERLATVDSEALPAVQLNQLLVLAHEAPVSDGFFRYYWLDFPGLHPYSVRAIPGFDIKWENASAIISLDHLAWGLHRLYIDGLLYFGNVRTAFRTLRVLSWQELQDFFAAKRIDTAAIERRGPPLPLRLIAKDKRYLIAEMACKSYGDNPRIKSDLNSALTRAFNTHTLFGGGATSIGTLLHDHLPSSFEDSRGALLFSAAEILDEQVAHIEDVQRHYSRVAARFDEARRDALRNTEYYLSMLTDLDVYVATSMRTPQDFLRMGEICDDVFSDDRLKALNLRYFDPTLSAADGHEDKGLIECLMVKCAKALVYCGGEKESYGKDAEAAMALSLGRPVIFYCEHRADFYRQVHPLTRLIEFETGVAVGAMVTDKIGDVAELLARTFENRMVYGLERSRSGSIRLIEEVTGSVVRLQTSNTLLTETFWNHYHQDRAKRPVQAVAVSAAPGIREPARELESQPLPVQAKLDLGDTTKLTRLAARNAAQAITQATASAKTPPAAAIGSNEPFPLSADEVFDAVSKVKRSQSTGTKRFAAFSSWLTTENVGILEGLKLLRFIETTLSTHGARQSYTYTPSDLTRWYREMSSGDMVGTLT